MSSGTNILHLPDELLLLIAQNVSGQDLLNFALTCQRFSSVCAHLRKLNFRDAYSVLPADLERFFRTAVNPSIIAVLQFENCYWIPVEILSDAIQECVNITVLCVANTRMSHQHLMQVFSKCTLISQLSFTIEDPKSWVPTVFKECVLNLLSNGQSFREAFELTELRGSLRIFNQLVKLDLYMCPNVLLLATLLSTCDCLNSLNLTFYAPEGLELSDLRFEHVLDEIPENALTLGNLKSVILFFQSSLHFCRPYDIAIIYQERFIKRHLIERAGSQLKCVWSNAFKRSDRGISNSMKLVSNCRLFYADSSNCIGNIESIKHESYMDYGSNQMSPEIMFVDCVYKRKEFAKFCNGHSQLRKLRLRLRNRGVPTEYGLHEFTPLGSLRHLTSLSFDVGVLMEADYERRGHRRMDRPCAVLAELVNCRLPLEEFEIFNFEENFDHWLIIPSSDLSLIAKWTLLKRLSLGKFYVDEGLFVSDILRECPMLESLILQTVARNQSYNQQLCTALPLASNLKLLRLELNIEGTMEPMKHILDAISKCSSLVQLHLIVPSYNDLFGSGLTAQLFNYRILNLVDSLAKLVCLYCFLDVPQSHCATATKLLVETVTPKRPSFCAELLSQQVRPKYSSSLPFVHSRPLLDFKEDYSSLPYGD